MRRKETLLTTAIALALSATPFAVVSAQQQSQGQAQQTQQGQDGKIDLKMWQAEQNYDGWTAEQLFATPVYGSQDEDIGEIENLVIAADGSLQKIVVEAGGFLDIGDTHLAVPWNEVKVAPGLERVTVPVKEDNVEDFSLFDDDEVQTGERAWRASELINDYVSLQDYPGYGIVQDLVFTNDGQLSAVVVYPDVGYGVGAPYAYPYYGYDRGFEPGDETYRLPYTQNEISELGPFDYEAFEAPPPGVRQQAESPS